MNKYIQKFIVPCYDTDSEWRLKPASVMNWAQEIANLHAEVLGFGYDDLISSRTAWVLSRMHIKFVKTPEWKDEVMLSTWHKGLERLFYLRDYTINDKDGNPLVLATSSWLVLNLDTRKLVRDPNIMDENTMLRENATETSAPKIQLPKDIVPELVMSHKVAYSDVDLNGHTNNAMYMTWAMDAVDYSTASSLPVKDAFINFNHETKAGETVSLYRVTAQKDDGLHVYIDGRAGEVSAFCVELVF